MATHYSFVEFEKVNNDLYNYHYTYIITLQKLFRKQYIKVLFRSKKPSYLLKLDIYPEYQKYFQNNPITIEELAKNGKELNIGIGFLSAKEFDKEDILKFSKNFNYWQTLLVKTVEKQSGFEKLVGSQNQFFSDFQPLAESVFDPEKKADPKMMHIDCPIDKAGIEKLFKEKKIDDQFINGMKNSFALKGNSDLLLKYHKIQVVLGKHRHSKNNDPKELMKIGRNQYLVDSLEKREIEFMKYVVFGAKYDLFDDIGNFMTGYLKDPFSYEKVIAANFDL